MANPDAEIAPEDIMAVRDDAIIATGRSDYPNQINNVLGFPYLFRGALDVRASTINDEMKIAAARALADLAREDVPDEVDAAYSGRHLHYGPDYLIPAPFDPRLVVAVPSAVAKAAIETGVARKPITDMAAYRNELSARLDPTSGSLQAIFDAVRANPRRVVFAEGEEDKSIRAAIAFRNTGYGTPILIGREDRVRAALERLGLSKTEALEIHNAKLSTATGKYMDFIYKRLQRKGVLYRDCQRMVNQDRNVFAACMVALGHADAMVTGLTRNYYVALEQITRVLDPQPSHLVFGLTLLLAPGRTLFLSDTAVHELPSAAELAEIAIQTAAVARQLGHEPRLALVSFSNFGNPNLPRSQMVAEAVAILDSRKVDFEYDGEMSADVALNSELLAYYPFCRLSGPANVLVMPGLHSSHISTNLVNELGGGTVIGPLLKGLTKPAQIVPWSANVSDAVNMAALAAYDSLD
jgi:malate dehydrogenase (oxaloacetate-decarboxylating)(NADP+)